MKPSLSRPKRQLAVIINYGCIVLLLLFFYLGYRFDWSLPIIAGLVFTALVGVVSFMILHLNTRLWRMVHSKADELDERQLMVTRESLRYSYGIFTVVSLVVLLLVAVLGGWRDSLLMLIFASLLYLAHTLPASILAWREKEI